MDARQSLIGIVPLAVVFFLLSIVKTSLRSLSKVTLRRLAEESTGRTRSLLERFLQGPNEFILELQGPIQATLVAIAVLGTTAALRSGVNLPVLVSVFGLVAFVLLFEHFFPRYVASVDRERLLTRLLPAYAVFAPLGRLVAMPVNLLYRVIFHAPPTSEEAVEVSEEEVRAFIDVGEEAGILDRAEGEIVESIVDFGETLVREVMTPRVDVVSIDGQKTVAELRDLFLSSRHSRVPVFRERPDNIEGLVYIKDLLEAWKDGKEGEKVAAWMRPTVFVPESKKVSSLLKEFQKNHNSFAVVVDEYGGTAGIVTLENLLEEIVGDIQDEDDDEPAEAAREADGSWLLAGKVHVEKLEELFELNIGDADFETLAGLVFATLGRVPAAGEEFVRDGVRFKVVDADRHRVNKVRIWKESHRDTTEHPVAVQP